MQLRRPAFFHQVPFVFSPFGYIVLSECDRQSHNAFAIDGAPQGATLGTYVLDVSSSASMWCSIVL